MVGRKGALRPAPGVPRMAKLGKTPKERPLIELVGASDSEESTGSDLENE